MVYRCLSEALCTAPSRSSTTPAEGRAPFRSLLVATVHTHTRRRQPGPLDVLSAVNGVLTIRSLTRRPTDMNDHVDRSRLLHRDATPYDEVEEEVT